MASPRKKSGTKQPKKVKTAKASARRTATKSKNLSFHLMVPNMMTITALCFGLTAIQFSISERWEAAVLSIVIAAFIDAFDGAAARLLKADSKLGAELDSFSDFLCFGVAPALMMYLWALQDMGRWGWMASLIFCVAVALRLARFNASAKTQSRKSKTALDHYFTGVPAPTGAGMCLLPLIINFQAETPFWNNLLHNPVLVGGWALIIATLMVSRVPTFSTKQIKLSQKFIVPALAGFGLLTAGLINAPWPTLTLMGIVYTGLIPVGIFHYYRTKKASDNT